MANRVRNLGACQKLFLKKLRTLCLAQIQPRLPSVPAFRGDLLGHAPKVFLSFLAHAKEGVQGRASRLAQCDRWFSEAAWVRSSSSGVTEIAPAETAA